MVNAKAKRSRDKTQQLPEKSLVLRRDMSIMVAAPSYARRFATATVASYGRTEASSTTEVVTPAGTAINQAGTTKGRDITDMGSPAGWWCTNCGRGDFRASCAVVVCWTK